MPSHLRFLGASQEDIYGYNSSIFGTLNISATPMVSLSSLPASDSRAAVCPGRLHPLAVDFTAMANWTTSVTFILTVRENQNLFAFRFLQSVNGFLRSNTVRGSVRGGVAQSHPAAAVINGSYPEAVRLTAGAAGAPLAASVTFSICFPPSVDLAPAWGSEQATIDRLVPRAFHQSPVASNIVMLLMLFQIGSCS